MDPRYPTGPFAYDAAGAAERRATRLALIGSLPDEMATAVAALPSGGLDRPYREGGWTARQVVHHVADSHANAYIRFKLALTEDEPTVRPYDQDRWAALPDARTLEPAISLAILRGIHQRLHHLLATLTAADFARTARHPEHGPITVDWLLQMYAWHGRHHVAQLGLITGRA